MKKAVRRAPVVWLGLLACLQFSGAGRAAEMPAMTGPIQLAQTQPAVTVSPASVDAGATATLVITANGTVDLSGVAASQIGVRPGDGIANITILSQSAQQLTVSLDVAKSVATGVRTLFIDNAQGAEIVALDLQVVGVPVNACAKAHCGEGKKCCPDIDGAGFTCIPKNQGCD
jgi:hypothetical protein